MIKLKHIKLIFLARNSSLATRNSIEYILPLNFNIQQLVVS